MKALFAHKYALAALVIVVLGALYGLAGLSHPVALAAGSQSRPPNPIRRQSFPAPKAGRWS